jgi:hypothetical protein
MKLVLLPLKPRRFLLYTAILDVFNKSFTLFTLVALKAECGRICELCSIQPSYKSSYFPWTCQIWKLTKQRRLIKLG